MLAREIINESQLRKMVNCGFTHAIVKSKASSKWRDYEKTERLQAVFDCIKSNDKITRLELAPALRMSLPTLKKYMAELLEQNRIIQVLTGGRGKQAYFIVNEEK